MSSIPVPDEQTRYSSRRQDDVDVLAWPVFSQRALDLLRSAGAFLRCPVLALPADSAVTDWPCGQSASVTWAGEIGAGK